MRDWQGAFSREGCKVTRRCSTTSIRAIKTLVSPGRRHRKQRMSRQSFLRTLCLTGSIWPSVSTSSWRPTLWHKLMLLVRLTLPLLPPNPQATPHRLGPRRTTSLKPNIAQTPHRDPKFQLEFATNLVDLTGTHLHACSPSSPYLASSTIRLVAPRENQAAACVQSVRRVALQRVEVNVKILRQANRVAQHSTRKAFMWPVTTCKQLSS